jgi:uncharacterized membrane protein YraQ (UPF0718 family)
MAMIRRTVERIGNGGLFVFGVLVGYVVVALVDFELARNAFSVLGRLLARIGPILIAVFAIMFLTNLLMEMRGIVRLLGKGSGLRGWLLAITGGIFSSGPIYMWYPLLADLKERGMRECLIATFLYNRAIKIPLIPMMIYYFGWVFTVILSIYMVLFSIINGIVVERLTDGGNSP